MAGKKLTLSKSQYVKGLGCPLALWFYRAAANDNAPSHSKISKESDASREARRAAGEEIGRLARAYFKGGAEVGARYPDIEGAENETLDLIAAGVEAIFEATAINPADGAYCSIDVLRRVPGTDLWDMIEVKSATRVKAHYIDDISFQRHVFEGAGYKIRNCYIMHVDRDYVRRGAVDPQKLFRLQNVGRGVAARSYDVAPNIGALTRLIDGPQPPAEGADRKCSPNNCDNGCWANLPLYSIFNVYSGKDVEKVLAQTGSYDIRDIPENLKPDHPPKRRELEAHLSGQRHVDRQALQDFLGTVEYPVYYLDYEAVMDAVPLYEGTSPYQQIPFQFSLHVQEEEGGALTHHGFLHKNRTDPRRAFAEELIRLCGTKGSVVVYFKDYEAGRNDELAKEFPDLAPQLKAINTRMVDIFEPFRQRWLYDPAQNGSVSLKTVLPTYTNVSYKDMAIGNGEQASREYLSFVAGLRTDPKDLRELWDGLEEYCRQDTYAMARLMDVLKDYAAGRAPSAGSNPGPEPS